MALQDDLNRLQKQLGNFLFPRKCPFCGAVTGGRLLAASLCVDWHVAPVETLRKAVDNPAQSGLTDAEHRRANVLGVYEALPENVRDKRLLLIDDIVTTGSTLTECVRVLREAGAADVVCLTLARTEEEH